MSDNEKILTKLDKIIEIMAYNSIMEIDDVKKKIFTLIKMGLDIEIISRLTDQTSSTVFEIVLKKIASTKERKMIWVLLDGKNDNKKIADKINITERAVRNALNQLEDAGLIEKSRGKPASKNMEIIPSDWISLLPSG